MDDKSNEAKAIQFYCCGSEPSSPESPPDPPPDSPPDSFPDSPSVSPLICSIDHSDVPVVGSHKAVRVLCWYNLKGFAPCRRPPIGGFEVRWLSVLGDRSLVS